MGESDLPLVSQIGGQILRRSGLSKDFLVRNLRQAANLLSKVDQPLAERLGKVETALKPLAESVVKHDLASHEDNDVRLLVAVCATELFRIMAPEPPFGEGYLQTVFKLIVSTFAELAEMESPYFPKRVKVLETFARLGLCVIMLDIECYDLIVEMFHVLFHVVREQHQWSLTQNILSILKHVIDEEAPDQLLEIILQNLLKQEKGAPSASSLLAISIIQMCSEKIEPFIRRFLTSCMSMKQMEGSALKKSYHEIIYKIFVSAPQMLFSVIPNIMQELLNDDPEVRRKAVQLLGRIFAVPEHHAAQDYHGLFVEFLNRFSDKSMEVRISALQCVKGLYVVNSSGSEVQQVLSALEARLLDFEDRVRMEAVTVVCDIALSDFNFLTHKLVPESTQRLRDKSTAVRKKALKKLVEVYRVYCSKCSEGCMTIGDQFEQIPCKVLMLCYDKNCKEFRSHNMELLLAEELFPDLSPLERTRHWIHMFSLFEPPQFKALSSILSCKRRFQMELRKYLGVRAKEKENHSDERDGKVRTLFKKLSASFPDPAKAEASFYKLDQLKDSYIFDALPQLLDEMSITNAGKKREEFLQRIGVRHPNFDFLSSVSLKCSFNIFSLEHVKHTLDYLSDGSGHIYRDASAKLLLAIADYCPSLLRGSEVELCTVLEKNEEIGNEIIEALARAGSQISIVLSNIYNPLVRVCLEGSRKQAKSAVSAIAAIMGPSDDFASSELYKKLVDSLRRGVNLPTVLQSLGCTAKHLISDFEHFDREITPIIHEQIFQLAPLDYLELSNEDSGCSGFCKLKIYGLKALVNSFLSRSGTHVKRNINQLLHILRKMLHRGNTIGDVILSETDGAHARLAAAKSVLRISKRWDLLISPDIFSLTVLMVKDSSSFVRRSFLEKTFKLLREHAIPSKYACALALATSADNDLQNDSLKYVSEFVREYSREERISNGSAVQGSPITGYPAYIVVYLVHLLAHDADFPPEDCLDEQIFAEFCSPLFCLIRALVDANDLKGDLDPVTDPFSSLVGLFHAIRKAEDAVNAERTRKLHFLSQVGSSFTRSLRKGGLSSGRTPNVILLPSAYYKLQGNNSKEIAGYSGREGFIRRIIETSNSYISESVSTVLEYGVKTRENPEQSKDKKGKGLNTSPGKPLGAKTCAGKVTFGEVALGRKRGRLTSPVGEPAVEPPTVPKHRKLSSKQSRGKEGSVLSSCNSVGEMSSLMLRQEESLDVGRDDASIQENTEAGSAVTAEPSACSRAKPHDLCCLKEIRQNRHVRKGKQSSKTRDRSNKVK